MAALAATTGNRSISSIESAQMSLIGTALPFTSSTVSKGVSTTTSADLTILPTSANYSAFSMTAYSDTLWFVGLFEISEAYTKCLCNSEAALPDLSTLSSNATNACFDIPDNAKSISVIWPNGDTTLSLCPESGCPPIDPCNDQTQRIFSPDEMGLPPPCIVFGARVGFSPTPILKPRSILFGPRPTLTLYEFGIVCFDSMFIHTSLL